MAGAAHSLNGRVAAITGGARGIGRATATALLREGARVAIGDVDGDGARLTAEELGADAVGFDLDVTNRASFTAFIDRVEATHGPLDVLVNNAGIMPAGPFLDESDDTAMRQIDINVHGVILGMKIALPRMLERGRGHVVNMASAAGKGGFPGIVTYCGTKHAVVGISEAIRGELDGSGIEFSVVMPAFVNTELISGATKPRAVKVVEPEDVADAIVEALRKPRFDVFVPKSAGRINKVMQLLPRRGREGLARALKADRILTEIDWKQRAAYEDRVAHSEPSRPPAGDEPQEASPEPEEAPPEPVGRS
jgi:NAD(P)-dependent dehydrogenase (short-subunit alcohol dehydrogenase family)